MVDSVAILSEHHLERVGHFGFDCICNILISLLEFIRLGSLNIFHESAVCQIVHWKSDHANHVREVQCAAINTIVVDCETQGHLSGWSDLTVLAIGESAQVFARLSVTVHQVEMVSNH